MSTIIVTRPAPRLSNFEILYPTIKKEKK
jgi:hypothetical protein